MVGRQLESDFVGLDSEDLQLVQPEKTAFSQLRATN